MLGCRTPLTLTKAVTLPPTPRIIGYGTKIVIRTVDTPNGPVEYWRAYTMYATSYAAKYLSGSSRTASGTGRGREPMRPSAAAASPHVR